MKSLSKNKSTIFAIILFLIVLYAYNMFKDSLFTAPVAQENIGADIVELFGRLEKVSLDPAVFSSSLYLPLNDFSPTLVPQPTGRTNPFSAIGSN